MNLRMSGVWDLKLMAQKQKQPSRPYVFLPIFVSNADEQETYSVKQSFIYKRLYSELTTELTFKRYGPRREDF